MTYTEAVAAVNAGKTAWRPTGAGWGPTSAISKTPKGIVNTGGSAYTPTAEDQAATNWETGDKRP
jgi:hypothetical protein